jgi:hypothetical protein
MSDLLGAGHNRLSALAANIRALHAGVRRSAEQAARDAKALLKHGEWEPWLRDNVAIAPRTARRDMALARSGLEPANVADLGMNTAAGSRVARIRRHARKGWEHFIEAGRLYGKILDELGGEETGRFEVRLLRGSRRAPRRPLRGCRDGGAAPGHWVRNGTSGCLASSEAGCDGWRPESARRGGAVGRRFGRRQELRQVDGAAGADGKAEWRAAGGPLGQATRLSYAPCNVRSS